MFNKSSDLEPLKPGDLVEILHTDKCSDGSNEVATGLQATVIREVTGDQSSWTTAPGPYYEVLASNGDSYLVVRKLLRKIQPPSKQEETKKETTVPWSTLSHIWIPNQVKEKEDA